MLNDEKFASAAERLNLNVYRGLEPEKRRAKISQLVFELNLLSRTSPPVAEALNLLQAYQQLYDERAKQVMDPELFDRYYISALEGVCGPFQPNDELLVACAQTALKAIEIRNQVINGHSPERDFHDDQRRDDGSTEEGFRPT